MRKITIAVVACLAMAVGAMAQNTALPESRTTLGGTNPEQKMSREVMHELLMDPYYSVFDDLEYKVNGNTVTLMGHVVDPAAKSDAEASVKHIEGVSNVDDQIKVLPPSPQDDAIRRAEYRAIFSEPGLNKYAWGAVPEIHIVVENGRVTLTGFVNNAGDKNLAYMCANGVPGVFGVTNNLQVASNTK